jgi:DNA fragmentation factor, 40 kD, beta subunit
MYQNMELYTFSVKVMRSSAKSRVRSYFYDARRAVQAAVTPSVYKEVFDTIFQNFHATLVENEFYADYFGRRAAVEIRLCDAAGWFNCQGPFDADTCPSLHLINPYDNKECRIVFSTWNLDHQIEKSRQVVPALLAAATAVPKGAMVNCNFFYGLLFTTANLRLVHIACHKKYEHATKVVEEKDYHIQLNTESTSKINSVLAKAPRSARKTMKTPTKVETRGRV